jgi:HD-GYP domain-containing protein (c-di-GMP phosphodiesterase class II)
MSSMDILDSVATISEETSVRAVCPASISDQLAALQSLNNKLICLQDDRLAYEEMVDAARRIIGCDFCGLYTYDSDRQTLRLRAWRGPTEPEADAADGFKKGIGAPSPTFRKDYQVYMPVVQQASVASRLAPGLRSELVIPILSKYGTIGVLDFGSRKAEAFGSHEIQLCSLLADQIAFSIENVRLLADLTATRDAVIHGMALLAESRDGPIGGHLKRLCAYSHRMSHQLMYDSHYEKQIDAEFVETITRSAALHDIGKVGIPDKILLKPGQLSASEFEIIKNHTVIGGSLLEDLMRTHGSFPMLKMGAEVAYSHHERWDGRGYPFSLSAEDIPLSARIVAVCDVYDALTSQRVYKSAMGHQKAVADIVRKAGSQFDPNLMDAFSELAPEFLEIHMRNLD